MNDYISPNPDSSCAKGCIMALPYVMAIGMIICLLFVLVAKAV